MDRGSLLRAAGLRALAGQGHQRFGLPLRLAVGWFRGENDASTPMFDPDSGGGYDGLQPNGRWAEFDVPYVP